MVKVDVGVRVSQDTDRCADGLFVCSEDALNDPVTRETVRSSETVCESVKLRFSETDIVRSSLVVTDRISVSLSELEKGAVSLNERTVKVGSLVHEYENDCSSESENVAVVDSDGVPSNEALADPENVSDTDSLRSCVGVPAVSLIVSVIETLDDREALSWNEYDMESVMLLLWAIVAVGAEIVSLSVRSEEAVPSDLV